jgi:serine protease Do
VVEVQVTGYGASDENSRSSSPVGRQRSLGAGIIVEPDGYIITNYHVIRGTDRVRVTLTAPIDQESQALALVKSHRRILPAKIVGVSKQIDLAVLKVEATELPTIPIGRYQQLQKGQIVLAFRIFLQDRTNSAGVRTASKHLCRRLITTPTGRLST